MVNHSDVKSLLTRLHEELQGVGSRSGTQKDAAKGISFAESLGAELDAAASGAVVIKGTAAPTVVSLKGALDGAAANDSPVDNTDTPDALTPVGQPAIADDAAAQLKVLVEAKGDQLRPVVAGPVDEENGKDDPSPVEAGGTETKDKPVKQHSSKHAAEGGETVVSVPGQAVEMQGVGEVSLVSPQASGVQQQSVRLDVKDSDGESQGPMQASGRAPIVAPRRGGATRPVAPGATEIAGAKQKVGVAAPGPDASQEGGTEQTGSHEGVPGSREQIRAGGAGDHPAMLTSGTVALAVVTPQQHIATPRDASVDGNVAAKDVGPGARGQFELRGELAAPDRTIVATPSTLEVGIANGSHGWLKIRAELTDAGTVTAALSSTTSAGAQTLHRDLPALSSFLDREQVSVTSLVVHQADSSGFFAGADGGDGRAGGQQPQQGDAGKRDRDASLDVEVAGVLDGLLEVQSGDGLSAGGGWLSVRA